MMTTSALGTGHGGKELLDTFRVAVPTVPADFIKRGGQSAEQLVDNIPVGVGQPVVSTLKAEGKAAMIDSQQVQHRGM